jgi:hypothetical protein
MKILFLGAAFILGVLVLGGWLSQSWDDDLALYVWDLCRLAQGLDSDREHARDLAVRSEAMTRYISAKMEVIQEVIDGKRSLLEAAASLRQLARTKPGFDERQEQSNRPGNSVEERYCREVIDWVRVILRHENPEQVQAATGRLESDLDEWLLYGTPGCPDTQVP